MDKKRINYILIAALVVIWALVGYKILSPYFKKSGNVLTAEMLPKKENIQEKKRDTFDLVFPQRDPFLDKQIRPSKKSASKETISTAPRPRPKINNQPWPEIQYFGFVKSKTNSNKLGLLKISGKLHRVKENHVVEGLKILRITPEETLVAKGKEKKTITKN